MVSQRLAPFGTSVFAEMTALANEKGAINLSQGFPDFDGPQGILDAVTQAMKVGENQYTRSRGHAALVRAIAESREKHYGLTLDPMAEVVVTSGATEAIASSLLGLLNPGDEAVLFEPAYDSYAPMTILAGAVPRFVTLRFPDFAFDEAALRAAVTDRTRVVVLNTPHNPTGKVFTREELSVIAKVAQERDLVVLADEVYEHLTFDDAVHVPIATLPGMRERTLTIGSTGKTFSLTGFKIGWAAGPKPLVDAVQAAHQFVTFCTATPFQVAMAFALREFRGPYLATFRAEYTERRNFLAATLREAGFIVAVPRGTYFILADFSALHPGDDRAFARWLVEEAGVAAIPPSPFYAADLAEPRRLVRFAFCKRMDTLKRAAERLKKIAPKANGKP